MNHFFWKIFRILYLEGIILGTLWFQVIVLWSGVLVFFCLYLSNLTCAGLRCLVLPISQTPLRWLLPILLFPVLGWPVSLLRCHYGAHGKCGCNQDAKLLHRSFCLHSLGSDWKVPVLSEILTWSCSTQVNGITRWGFGNITTPWQWSICELLWGSLYTACMALLTLSNFCFWQDSGLA